MSRLTRVLYRLLLRAFPREFRRRFGGELERTFQATAEEARREGGRASWLALWARTVPTVILNGLAERWSDGDPTMSVLLNELRLTARAAARRPLLTGVAVLSLAVGMAVSVTVFSLLDAAVFRPLPLRDPDALRVVLQVRETGINHNLTYPGYARYRAAQASFEGVVAYSAVVSAVARGDATEMAAGEIVSGNYFGVLGAPIAMGRGLFPSDDRAGAPPAVVLSDAEWRRHFGEVGELGERSVAINGTTFAVVGVAGRPFRGMQVGRDARFWAPLAFQTTLDPSELSYLELDGVSWLTVVGRLAPGVTDDRAVAELNTVGAAARLASDEDPRFTLAPGAQGDSRLPETAASPLLLLMGAALVVLLVACANVAGLLLARAADRFGEIAVRRALGADRWGVARLQLVESALIGAAGVVTGAFAAHWIAPRTVPLFTQFGEAVTIDAGLSWRAVGFAAVAGLVASLAVGAAPVIHARRLGGLTGLAPGSRSASQGRRAARGRRVLVVAQFALTLALVATATLLVRTLVNLGGLPVGLDVDRVALVSVDPAAVQYDPPSVRQYLERAEAALAALPGVEAAGYGRVIPVGFGGSRANVEIPGYQPAPDEDMELNYNEVTPAYADAVGLSLQAGRFLDGSDAGVGPLSVVVNQTMAERYWPAGGAVGRELRVGPRVGVVVGVVADVKYRMLREAPRPSFYLPLAQVGSPRGGVLHVRAAGDPSSVMEAVRRTLAEVDPAVPVADVRTLARQVELNVNRERVTMTIGLVLGGAALLLSAVGLFGTMAHMVGRRRRELGVRVAIGAAPGRVGRLVLRDGLKLSAWGAAAGVLLALWLGRLVEGLLFGVDAFDPLSLAAAALTLGLVAVTAAWVPARRAAAVPPVEALRVE